MRLILTTGGGGAGVTTLAAAAAVGIAATGNPVRLLSPDAAALDATLGPRAGLPPSLRVLTPEPEAALGDDAPAAIGWLRALLSWAGVSGALTDDVTSLAPIRLLAVLMTAADPFDGVTIVDAGPIAESLPLLHLLCTDPTIAIESDAFGSIAARLAGPIVTRLIDLPRPGAGARRAGEQAGKRLTRLGALLRDTGITSVRAVLPADGRARRTACEAETVSGLHGIALDAVIARGAGAAIGSGAGPSRLAAPWQSDQPAGASALAALSRAVHGDAAPAAMLSPARIPRIETADGHADLVIPLPERPAADFSVGRHGARLSVAAGAWRRTLILPPLLQPLAGRRAWHDGDAFRIRFER